jgi:predicted RNA-binding protein YlxR (DUF448 family)
MKNKLEPQRQCIGCKRVFPKKELLRFVKGQSGSIVIDRKKILPGRGVYLCPDENCFSRARKGKVFQKMLGIDSVVGDEDARIMDALIEKTDEFLCKQNKPFLGAPGENQEKCSITSNIQAFKRCSSRGGCA